MKQLVIGVLLAALLSLGYRLAATMIVEANDTPAPAVPEQQRTPKEEEADSPVRAIGVRIDWTKPEHSPIHDLVAGPDSSRKNLEATLLSHAISTATAKPLHGEQPTDLAIARPAPAAPAERRLFGPDGIVYRRVGSASSTACALRMNPPPVTEPLVQTVPAAPTPEPLAQNDHTATPEPQPSVPTAVAPSRGRMIGPDGIEYHTAKTAP